MQRKILHPQDVRVGIARRAEDDLAFEAASVNGRTWLLSKDASGKYDATGTARLDCY